MKKALSLILAVIMAFGGITAAFAAEIGDTLKWYFDEELYEYSYQGEITEGTLTISNELGGENYYTFNAEKAGFYSFEYDYWNNDIYFYTPEKIENGIAYNSLVTSDYSNYETEEFIDIFYLNVGENIIGADVYYVNGESADIEIEFLGETAAIVIEDELVIDYDAYNYADHYVIYDAAKAVFPSGKEIPLNYLESVPETVALEGENTSNCIVSGQKVSATFTACSIDKYVKDVSITNVEKYLTLTQNYDGNYDYDYPLGEKIVVTFTDGTTKEILIGEDDEMFTLPNGREYWIYYYYDTFVREPALVITLGDNILKSYKCTVEEAPVSEKFAAMFEENINNMKNSSYYFRVALASLFTMRDIEDLSYELQRAAYYFGRSFECFVDIFVNFGAFVGNMF